MVSLADASPSIALGALDGRYRGTVAPLVDHLSEAALNRERIRVEVEWLIHLTTAQIIPNVRALTAREQTSLRSVDLYENIAQWLKALRELPVLQEQVTLFAEGLATKYSRLSHLRRALRETQLLPEPEPQPPKLPRPGTAPRPVRKAKNPFGR